ncbi:MAG: hypothetical protein IPI50_09615 [Saprospiraceae bacterium]|nr:hypothetical protein [Saprospiraceae bacterium]
MDCLKINGITLELQWKVLEFIGLPLYIMLSEEAGIGAILVVNTKHVKNVTTRKERDDRMLFGFKNFIHVDYYRKFPTGQ